MIDIHSEIIKKSVEEKGFLDLELDPTLDLFAEIEKLKKEDEETTYDDIISWFFNQNEGFELLDDLKDEDYKKLLDDITPLDDLLNEHQPKLAKEESYFVKEFVLWALVEFKQLNKFRFSEGIQFKDPYGSFISGI